MKPEEQRIAIAGACGIKVIPCTCENNPWKDANSGKHIPDYMNDLNAMHEAEKSLAPEIRWRYITTIGDILDTEAGRIGGASSLSIVCACAALRAEAFLKTLNLWKE